MIFSLTVTLILSGMALGMGMLLEVVARAARSALRKRYSIGNEGA